MRALFIGALGLLLAGCSHSSPQASLTSCAGAYVPPCAGSGSAAQGVAAASVSVRARPAPVRAATAPPKMIHASKVPAEPPRKVAASFGAAQASMDMRRPAAGVTAPVAEAIREHVAAARQDNGASPPADTDRLVAVVMARPDVTSVSELAGKTIAIDDRYAASNASVRTALVAAGAPQVQLSEGQTTAVSRLSNGEVPAAVLALVTPEAAETFPAIAGYRMFHVPLSPRSEKARR